MATANRPSLKYSINMPKINLSDQKAVLWFFTDMTKQQGSLPMSWMFVLRRCYVSLAEQPVARASAQGYLFVTTHSLAEIVALCNLCMGFLSLRLTFSAFVKVLGCYVNQNLSLILLYCLYVSYADCQSLSLDSGNNWNSTESLPPKCGNALMPSQWKKHVFSFFSFLSKLTWKTRTPQNRGVIHCQKKRGRSQ